MSCVRKSHGNQVSPLGSADKGVNLCVTYCLRINFKISICKISELSHEDYVLLKLYRSALKRDLVVNNSSDSPKIKLSYLNCDVMGSFNCLFYLYTCVKYSKGFIFLKLTSLFK